MRIRNRKVPLPLSSLSPVPLSDPQYLSRSPVVQLQLHDDPHQNLPPEAAKDSFFDPQLSNQTIGGGSNGGDCSDDEADEGPLEVKKALFQEGEKEGAEEGEKSNDTRESPKGRILGAGMVFQQSSSSRQGDKAFPLKKRRGSFDRRLDEEIMEKDKKMKTKMNKKCAQQNGNQGEDQSVYKETKEGLMDGISNSSTTTNTAASSSINAKKRGRGSALMEGSRCSRVNGRGWRCCQQTLVGYSLCEHHLGKGRLRSMNSVRSRSMATSTTATKNSKSCQPLSSPQSTNQILWASKVDGDEVEDAEEKKPLVTAAAKKKKMKLGTVKARSMSSLLGQADNSIAVAENNK